MPCDRGVTVTNAAVTEAALAALVDSAQMAAIVAAVAEDLNMPVYDTYVAADYATLAVGGYSVSIVKGGRVRVTGGYDAEEAQRLADAVTATFGTLARALFAASVSASLAVIAGEQPLAEYQDAEVGGIVSPYLILTVNVS